jgi:hypothetical protein
MESLLAIALTLRKAQVHILLCDKVLPGCLQAEWARIPDAAVFTHYQLPKMICNDCVRTGTLLYQPLDLSLHWLSRLLTEPEKEEIKTLAVQCPFHRIAELQYDALPVGEHAYAGALRYFLKGDLSDEPQGEVILRRYLEASLLTAAAVRRLLQEHQFEAACFHHGIYVPQGIIGAVCRSDNVRVINWHPAYRNNCFIFSHDDTYHHTLLSEPTTVWENMEWSAQQEQETVAYLKSRWQGTRDWIWFHEKPDEDMARFAQEHGLAPTKPCIGLLSNVVWDAQLHYRANAFPNMLVWVMETIRYFAARPDLQLLIRIHPAEVRGSWRSRQPLLPEIRKVFPSLPKNVFIIPPESQVSTYAAMELCNAVLIYGTKTGVELTSMGIPVIVAGEAWIRNKGLTLDASSPEEYRQLLDRLPLPGQEDPALLRRARQYAFHFFFRRMIPLPFMSPLGQFQKPLYEVTLSQLDQLLPGVYPGLDVICDGILAGKPFVYPAERLGVHDA